MPIALEIPGSKSYLNRILVMAALCDEKTKIFNPIYCDDTNYMLSSLESLGYKISKSDEAIIIEKGLVSDKSIKLQTGNAGTTTRFLTAFCTLLEKTVIIDGDAHMQTRPISELVKALNTLGAKTSTETGCPPVKIWPQRLKGGSIEISGEISSQYISALLIIVPQGEQTTTINITTPLCSKPYVDMTIKIMAKFGLKVTNENYKKFTITPQKPSSPKKITIEGDASSASYFGALAAIIPKNPITLININKNSTQGDIAFLELLEDMGCKIEHQENSSIVRGPENLTPLNTISMNSTPDLVMTFSVLSMFSKGKTKITDIENLKIKETDRLKALENEISKFGISVRVGQDFIEIEGNPERMKEIRDEKISINTYNDHRIAMCFGILTAIMPNLEIENPNCVSKSYPTFWKDLKKATK